MKGDKQLIIFDTGLWHSLTSTLPKKSKPWCKYTFQEFKNTTSTNGFLGEWKINDEKTQTGDPTEAKH